MISHLSFSLLPFLALTGWWFLRNWQLYGDLTGTRPMLEMLPLRKQMSLGTLVIELPGLFHSWWGAFGCTAPPSGFYLFYLVIVLGGLVGLAVDRRRIGRDWPQVGVLLAWLALMGAAYARWNWVIHAAKGRLLYPAMVAVIGLLARGWAAWSARWRWLSLVVIGLCVLGAAVVPLAVMAPRISPPPIRSPSAEVHPAYPLNGRFGDEIAL